MAKKNLEIHSENILPIIKKWLYSEKEIFFRELISNACDALLKRKVLFDHGETESAGEPRIDVRVDKENKTLTFSDTGVGMNREEVEKYLSQIAFSGAEEFIKSYESHDPFIGHFGLGFYSAYMVADKVVVETLSCKPNEKPVRWICDGSSSYELEDGSRTAVGTDIILYVNNDHLEFLEAAKVTTQLKRFSSFLPYPIFCNEKRINENDPLWIKAPHTVSKEEYLAFFRSLYPFEEEPLFWIHLNIDYPFHLKGILYFPRLKKRPDAQHGKVALYSNRVFVSDDCKEILPEYLSFMRGAIDSPDIPLNVSRSYLQVDKTVRQLSSHISKKVLDALSSLYKQDLERFKAVWEDAEITVKLGMLQDDSFFQKAQDILVFQTTGNEFVSINTAREKSNGTVYYINDQSSHPHLLDVFEQKGYDVLVMKGPLDTAIMAHLEQKNQNLTFKRIDATDHAEIHDPSREKTLLDSSGKTDAFKMAAFVKEALDNPTVDVEAKSLATDSLPGFLSMHEEERRFRDYMKDISGKPVEAIKKQTFLVNTNSPLINTIFKLKEHNTLLAKQLVRHLFDITKLSQKEMGQDEFKAFVSRSHHLLQEIADVSNKEH